MFAFLRSSSFFAPSSFRAAPRLRLANFDLVWMAIAITIALLIAAVSPAKAGNTVFLTDRNGQITFPLSPPNRATGGPGALDNTDIGITTPARGRFTQMQPGGGQPTIASGACGTGTNGAVVAGSTAMSGQITIGAAATTTCTVVFAAALSVAPRSCTFFPMNATAAATGTTVAYGSAPTTTGFVLNGSALANANYAYQCF